MDAVKILALTAIRNYLSSLTDEQQAAVVGELAGGILGADVGCQCVIDENNINLDAEIRNGLDR